jgi:predicted PurR-regulated permease PerM
MGAAAALGCLLLGLKLWLLIGLFVVVASLIPVFGPYVGAVPAIAAALIGPTHLHNNVLAAVLILVYFIVINEVGSKVLYPKLVGAALGLHTVLVLFVLFAGLEISGIVGVLFAAPLTALVIVSVVHLYRLWQDLPDSLLSDVARREGPRTEHEPLP